MLISFLGPRHGPPGFSKFNRWVTKRLTAWQLSALTLVGYYILRNIDALLNLQPRPSNQALYSRSFGRAVSVVTAANAGAWTALPIKPKFVRDIASIVFAVYYMFTPDHAEEKSRKFNYNTSADHIRAAFELVKNPYLAFFGRLKRKKLAFKKHFQIPRPKGSIYARPVEACIWYNKPVKDLMNETKLIFHVHGGGFITTDAELHADSLTAWALQTGVPIVAINYNLAPEYPFPYALDECYEAYVSIMDSLGLCVGLAGTTEPDVVLTGDSAGGNLVAATMLKIIMTNNHRELEGLPKYKKPVSLVLTYPALDLGPAGIYGKVEMDLIRQQARDDGTNNVLEKKQKIVDTYYAGKEPVPMKVLVKPGTEIEEHIDRHPLTLSSRILFFSDGILAAPALYCMVLLYMGTDRGSTDFKKEHLLSPLWADDSLLAEFPKCYITCGDIDPLVDDSVMFVSRLRNARKKYAAAQGTLTLVNSQSSLTEVKTQEMVLASSSTKDHELPSSTTVKEIDIKDVAEIKFLTAVSHGFLQFEDVFPEAKQVYEDIGKWFMESFKNAKKFPTRAVEVDLQIYSDPFKPCRHGCA